MNPRSPDTSTMKSIKFDNKVHYQYKESPTSYPNMQFGDHDPSRVKRKDPDMNSSKSQSNADTDM